MLDCYGSTTEMRTRVANNVSLCTGEVVIGAQTTSSAHSGVYGDCDPSSAADDDIDVPA